MNTPKPDFEEAKARTEAALEEANRAYAELQAFMADWRRRHGIEPRPQPEAAE